MSSELGVSSELRHPIVPPPSPNIGDLPQELLHQILRKLGPHDLQVAACVSRGMNRSVIALANSNERCSIKNFIKILVQKLPEQRERLVEIAQNRFFQDFANLQQLKGSILDVKAQLIDVIKTVDEETAKSLRDVRPPHFLENIFTLAAFERQIDEAYLIPDEDERWYELRAISQALVRAGHMDRSVEVATSIPDDWTRGDALRDISQALARAGDIDRSVEVARSIPHEGKRDYALRGISQALARTGDMDRAVAVATSIPNEIERGYALLGISQALTQAGDMDRARVVATSIPYEGMKEFAL